MAKKKPELLEAIIKPKFAKFTASSHMTYEMKRNALFSTDRKQDDPYLMNFINTGHVSHMAYGAHVRSVEMTRGNRQGNNAFLTGQVNQQYFLNNYRYTFPESWLTEGIFGVPEAQMFEKSYSADLQCDLKQSWSGNIPNWIQYGEYKLPIYLLKELTKYSHYGYNDLHLNVLKKYKKDEKLPAFKYASVAKKGGQGLTPLHFACINPDVNVLKQLLSVNNDINIQTTDMRRLIHYAAVCESPAPLEYLISRGANVLDIDLKKVHCLHMAIKANRPKNVKVILAVGDGKPQLLLKMRDKQNNNPMSLACEG